jgi:hypothetical protein
MVVDGPMSAEDLSEKLTPEPGELGGYYYGRLRFMETLDEVERTDLGEDETPAAIIKGCVVMPKMVQVAIKVELP